MRKLLIVPLLILGCYAYGQSEITVKLNESESGPFFKSRYIVSLDQNDIKAKTVPEGLNDYHLRSTRLHYDKQGLENLKEVLEEMPKDTEEYRMAEIGGFLKFLIGTDTANNIIVIPDVNNNLDFTDDRVFKFPNFETDEEKKEYLESYDNRFVLGFNFYNGTGFEKDSVRAIIDPYVTGLTVGYPPDTDPNISKYILAVSYQCYRMGETVLQDKDYRVYVTASTRPDLSVRPTIKVTETDKDTLTRRDTEYELGDDFHIDGHMYSFKAVSPGGKELTLEYKGYAERPEGREVGLYLPELEVTDLDGNKHNLSEMKGKYLIMDFWGTWCNPCIKALPDFRALYHDFKDGNCVFVSVAANDKLEKVKKFVAENDMQWLQTLQEGEDIDLIKQLRVRIFPTVMIVDPEGRILYRDSSVAKAREVLEQAVK